MSTLKDEFVSGEHYLLALTSASVPAAKALQGFGVTRDKLMQALQQVRGSQRVTDQNPEGKYQTLQKYGRDLTEPARKGTLDPVIGRDDDIRRTMQVLSRSTRNHPVHIGGPAAAKRITGPADSVARYGQFDPAHYWQNVTMSPDFPSVGRVIAQLFPESGGVPIDGVLRLDPAALQGLLQLAGPVTVPGIIWLMWLPRPLPTPTSTLMIGITSSASLITYPLRGGIDPFLSAPTAIGVFVGATVGSRISHRIDLRILRGLFVAILLYTALQMLLRAIA